MAASGRTTVARLGARTVGSTLVTSVGRHPVTRVGRCETRGVGSESTEPSGQPTAYLAGKLLVATPSVEGDVFRRSVVLLLHHDADGAQGVVLNQPLEAGVDAVLPGWQAVTTAPQTLFRGGPVGTDSAIGIVSVPGEGEATLGVQRLFGGIGVVDLDAPPLLVAPEVAGLRIFAGYAGWSEGQLEGEIEMCLRDRLDTDVVRIRAEQDAREQCSVELLADVGRGTFVGCVCVLQKVECLADALLQFGEVRRGGLALADELGVFCLEPALLGQEEAVRDGVGVVGVEEFGLVRLQSRGFLVEVVDPRGVRLMLAAQACESDSLDALALRDGQRDAAVAVCDALLDLGDGKCLALGASGFATVTQEILVQALAATGVLQDQPVPTPEAVDRAL